MGYVELKNLNNAQEAKPITRKDLYEFGEFLAVNLRRDIKKDIEEAVDGLAIVVAKSFKDVYGRFDKIDIKFDEIDSKFNKIDERFEKIDERFEKIDQRFDGIDRRLDNMEISIRGLDDQLSIVGVAIKGIDSRLTGTNNRIDDLAMNYTRRDEHTKLEKRVETLELSHA